MTQQHIMLDLETMGSNPNAAIIAIGAVKFDPGSQKLTDEIYITIDLESSVKSGGIMDAETVRWWMKQSEAARHELFFDAMYNIYDALQCFHAFLDCCSEFDNRLIYGNGADFDNVILASAYSRITGGIPWKFYNNRCYRTLKNLRPDIKLERIGTAHHALDDAKSQALHCMKIMQALQKDKIRLDWLADKSNPIGNVQLPTQCVTAHIDDMRAAIDEAMIWDT